MIFNILYHESVKKDIKKLHLSNQQLTKLKKKIELIAQNPFPKNQGGLGEPLSTSLKGFLKFRFDNDYRVVYQLKKENEQIFIIIIGLRSDATVYKNTEIRVKY